MAKSRNVCRLLSPPTRIIDLQMREGMILPPTVASFCCLVCLLKVCLDDKNMNGRRVNGKGF